MNSKRVYYYSLGKIVPKIFVLVKCYGGHWIFKHISLIRLSPSNVKIAN